MSPGAQVEFCANFCGQYCCQLINQSALIQKADGNATVSRVVVCGGRVDEFQRARGQVNTHARARRRAHQGFGDAEETDDLPRLRVWALRAWL